MRCYSVVIDDDEGFIIAIIANTAKEARAIAYHSDYCCEQDWIDIHPKWVKNVDTTGLQEGVISILKGMELGIYDWAEMHCPICDSFRRVELYDNVQISCYECYTNDDSKKESEKFQEEQREKSMFIKRRTNDNK